MGLENILSDFRRFSRRLISGSLLGASLLVGCSGGSDESSNITRPPIEQPKPPVPKQNQSPIITSGCPSPSNVDENQVYQCSVQATDPDGDPLSYRKIQGPEWIGFGNNGSLLACIAPDFLQNQSFNIEYEVYDGKGGTARQSFVLNVQNVSNTYVLSSTQLSGLSNVASNSLTFSQPVSFVTKDIIGAGISDKTPEGLLREVTSISSDKKTVYTSRATLEQTISNASLSFSKRFYPSDIQSSDFIRGASMAPSNILGFDFSIDLKDVVLYDRDGDSGTKNDRLTANGSISFGTDSHLDLDIDLFKLKYFMFQNISSEKADISIGATSLGVAQYKEVKIAEYRLSPFVIGYVPTLPLPLPVIVTPKIEVNVFVSPTFINPLSVRVSQEASLETKLTYSGSWSSSSTFSNNFSFTNPVFNGDWNLNVGAGPKLELYVYGALGPIAAVNAGLRLTSQKEDYSLYGKLDAAIGASMEIFGKGIFAHAEKVIEYEKLLSRYEKPGAPSGGKVAFARVTGNNADIYSMNLDGSNVRNLTNSSSLWDIYPSWSSDGLKILYSSKIPFSSDDADVYIMDADGSNKKVLVNSSMEESHPVFSPDQSQIAYGASHGTNSQIYIADANGLNSRNITGDNSHHYWDISWSPVAQILAFSSNRDHQYGEIYKIKTDGSGLTRLTNNTTYDRFPGWSPDGNKLTFTSLRTGDYEIWIMDSDGSNLRNVTNSQTTQDENSCWSLDGKKIVYSSKPIGTAAESNELWIIDMETSAKTRLTTNSYDDGSPSCSR